MSNTLTEKQAKFLELIFLPEYSNDYKKAAIEAGYSENSNVSDLLQSDTISKEIAKRVDALLSLNAPRVALRVLDVLANPEMKGAKALLEACWGILDRMGVSKRDRLEVEHKAASGVFIIPAKKD